VVYKRVVGIVCSSFSNSLSVASFGDDVVVGVFIDEFSEAEVVVYEAFDVL
jgi:hypothetical protein